jgi:hypothetical protein
MNWKIFRPQMEECLPLYILLKIAEEIEEDIEKYNNVIKYAA